MKRGERDLSEAMQRNQPSYGAYVCIYVCMHTYVHIYVAMALLARVKRVRGGSRLAMHILSAGPSKLVCKFTGQFADSLSIFNDYHPTWHCLLCLVPIPSLPPPRPTCYLPFLHSIAPSPIRRNSEKRVSVPGRAHRTSTARLHTHKLENLSRGHRR